MIILISGGAKNGKSSIAQNYAREMAEQKGLPLYYVATMIPKDSEDRARIQNHLKQREGMGFVTLECGSDLSEISHCDGLPRGVYLLDSTTAFLSNIMFPGDCEDDEYEIAGETPVFSREELPVQEEALICGERMEFEPEALRAAGRRAKKQLTDFARWAENAVFVSDGIYSDAATYGESVDIYRKALADCDRALAEIAQRVIEVSAGRERIFK